MLKLVREVRFGLHAKESAGMSQAANGFAGNPLLRGIAPFLTLQATLTGQVDPATGMLINIKIVDRVLRDHAVPFLREACYHGHNSAAHAVKALFKELQEAFAPHRLAELSLQPSPYLSFSSDVEDAAMVKLTQRFEFSAAHRLHAATLSDADNREVFGRCNNPSGHGHNYELEVCVAGPVDEKTGEVMDIETLQRIVNKNVIDVFDHKHLNIDCPEFSTLNPTVENIAAVIFSKLQTAIGGGVKLDRVRVWETPKTFCEVSA